MEFTRKPSKAFSDLVEIVETLRRECPWDREQTHESIKELLIEETYEAIDSIEKRDFDELKKELGDLLLHVVFHSVMAQENAHFAIEDVVYGLQDKLIARHPHVYGKMEAKTEAKTKEEVLQNWETNKLKEKNRKSILEGVPDQLPGLLCAQRMQEKVSTVGFDWPKTEQAWEKVEEELQEWKEAVLSGDKEHARMEFGDFLFSLVNVGRFLALSAEDSLRQTNHKFKRRFQYLEEELKNQGIALKDAGLEQMDALWEEAKSKGL